MHKIWILIAAFAMLSNCCAQTITTKMQSSYELKADISTDKTEIVLTEDPALDFSKLNFRIIHVKTGNKVQEKDAFTIEKAPARNTLIISTNMRKLTVPATYELTISYGTDSSEKGIFPVSLVRPAAKLDSLSNIRIYIAGSKITRTEFVLKESGLVSDISKLIILAPYFNMDTKEALTPLSFPDNPFIKAGQPKKIRYEIDREQLSKFPLGKTSGKLTLYAPELGSTISFPVEVSKRVRGIWIFITFFFGVTMGLLVRTILKRKKEWEESKLKGYGLIDEIRQEGKKVKDDLFREKINIVIGKLHMLLKRPGDFFIRTDGVSSFNKKLEDITKEYNAEKDAFKQSVDGLKAKLKPFSGILNGDNLSSVIDRRFAKSISAYKKAGVELGNFNPTAANVTFREVVATLPPALNDYRNYASALSDLLDKTETYPAKFPDLILTKIKELTTGIRTIIAELSTMPPTPVSTPDDLASQVMKSDLVQEKLEYIYTYLGTNVPGIYAKILNLPDALPATMEFKTALAAWLGEIESLISNTIFGKDPSVLFRPQVTADVNTAMEHLPQREKTFHTDHELKFPGITSVPGLPKNYPPVDYIDDDSEGLRTIEASVLKTEKNWLLYAIIQGLLVCIFLCLITYTTYASKFVGTINDFILLFLSALSVDISIESVLALRDKRS